MEIIKKRRIILNQDDNLRLINTTTNNTVLVTVNGPRSFFLVLVHNILEYEYDHALSRMREKQPPFELDWDNIKYYKLENNIDYVIIFNNTIKQIPRSIIQADIRYDILVYIPIIDTIDGWE